MVIGMRQDAVQRTARTEGGGPPGTDVGEHGQGQKVESRGHGHPPPFGAAIVRSTRCRPRSARPCPPADTPLSCASDRRPGRGAGKAEAAQDSVAPALLLQAPDD